MIYTTTAERDRINAENRAKYAAQEAAREQAKADKLARRREEAHDRALRMKETSCGTVEATGSPRKGCDCQTCVRRRKTKTAKQRARRHGQDPDAYWESLPKDMPDYRAERFERYGITEDDYTAMLKAQDYRCAICGTKRPGGRNARNSWHIDHDHATGKIRGLLCRSCSWGLGQFKDSIENLEAAIAYLQPES